MYSKEKIIIGKIQGLLGTDMNTIMGILFVKKKHEVTKISCE